VTVRVVFEEPVPVPAWRFPPTDELLLDVGLRVYRIVRTETVLSLDRVPEVRSGPSHVAVDDDGALWTFPACTSYLPGGRPEVQLQLDAAFGDLGPTTLMVACDLYLKVGAQTSLDLFLDGGWDLTIVEVRAAYHDWCAWYWDAMLEEAQR